MPTRTWPLVLLSLFALACGNSTQKPATDPQPAATPAAAKAEAPAAEKPDPGPAPEIAVAACVARDAPAIDDDAREYIGGREKKDDSYLLGNTGLSRNRPPSGGISLRKGGLRMGPFVVEGGPSQRLAVRFLRTLLPKLDQCYQTQRGQAPKLAGKGEAQFRIEMTGLVENATASGMHRGIEACMVNELKTLRFPKLKRVATVQFPFAFSPDGSLKPDPMPVPEPPGPPPPEPQRADDFMREHMSVMKMCRRQLLDREPEASALVTVRFTLGPDGASKNVVAESSNKSFGDCMEAAIRTSPWAKTADRVTHHECTVVVNRHLPQ